MCASSLIQARARNVASDAIAGKGNQARCRCTLALSPPKKQVKKKKNAACRERLKPTIWAHGRRHVLLPIFVSRPILNSPMTKNAGLSSHEFPFLRKYAWFTALHYASVCSVAHYLWLFTRKDAQLWHVVKCDERTAAQHPSALPFRWVTAGGFCKLMPPMVCMQVTL